MVYSGMDAGGVIEQDGAGFGVGQLELRQDDGDITIHQLVKDALFFAESHDGDAVDFALDHATHATGKNSGIAVGRADQDLVAVSDGDLLEALDEFWKEWIGNVFDDDPEQAAAARDQGAGVGIGKIIELFNGLPYPL